LLLLLLLLLLHPLHTRARALLLVAGCSNPHAAMRVQQPFIQSIHPSARPIPYPNGMGSRRGRRAPTHENAGDDSG
jgi:hypothetical protein